MTGASGPEWGCQAGATTPLKHYDDDMSPREREEDTQENKEQEESEVTQDMRRTSRQNLRVGCQLAEMHKMLGYLPLCRASDIAHSLVCSLGTTPHRAFQHPNACINLSHPGK